MKKYLIIILTFLLLNKITIPRIFAATQTSIDNGLKYLRSQQQVDGHIDGFEGVSDWATMAFSANGIDTTTVATASGKTLMEYLQANPPTPSSSSTDWSRRILTVTAATQNPYDFAGANLVNGLKTYYHDNQIGNTTADNDDIFGLLALLASRESTTSAIIADTTSFIITHQHADGGFSYTTDSATGSDIDDTAAAIMALVAAKNQGIIAANLQIAIDNAKTYIISHQNADGGFAYDPNPATSWDTTSNVSTTSWVTMAFAALGMSSDTQFTNAQNYLLQAQQTDGSFPYQPSFPPGDTFDTSYALTALEGVSWPIHIFSGQIPGTTTETPTPTQSTSPTPTPTPTPTLLPQANATPTPPPAGGSTPTPTPSDPTPTVTKQKELAAQISETPTNTPQSKPTQNAAVLGAKTKTQNQNKFPLLAQIFFGLGILLIFFHIGKVILAKKPIRNI